MGYSKLLAKLLGLGLIILLSACVSRPYTSAIRQAPEYNLQLTEIIGREVVHQDNIVRWGGTIASVDQFADGWQITVLERKLNRNGRPLRDSMSDGRFAIFVPATEDLYYHFELDREITVLGTVDGVLQGYIGKQEYNYPVIKAVEYRLWRDYYQYHLTNYYPHDYYHHYRHGLFWHNHHLCLSEYYWFSYHHHNRSSSLWSSSYRLRNVLDNARESIEDQKQTTATLPPRNLSKEEPDHLRRTHDAEKFKNSLRDKTNTNYDEPIDNSSNSTGSVTMPSQSTVAPSRSTNTRKSISVNSNPSQLNKKAISSNADEENQSTVFRGNKKNARTNRQQIYTSNVQKELLNYSSKKYQSFKPKTNNRKISRKVYNSNSSGHVTSKGSSSSSSSNNSTYTPAKSSSSKSSSKRSSSNRSSKSSSSKRSRSKISNK